VGLNASFTFDRAGQGLFYYGQIDGEAQSFSIVYDCGTLRNIKGAYSNLSDVIRNSFANKIDTRQPIGLLAISHFDTDHISHIPELLKIATVDTVMIPHVAKEIRAVLFAKFVSEAHESNERGGDWDNLRDFALLFSDPAMYFSEMGRARQVIGIRGSDDVDDGDNTEGPPQIFYVEGGQHSGGESIPNYFVHSGSPLFCSRIDKIEWLFRPLNVQEALPPSFYQEVRDLLSGHGDDWRSLLSDMKLIKSLRDIHDRYIGGEKHRNAHSLLLRHKPANYARLYTKRCDYDKLKCFECCNACYKRNYYVRTATVLLGDLVINDKAKKALAKHRFLSDGVGVALIPHHGAVSGDLAWLDKKLKNNGYCAALAVSYGTKNIYGHPRFIRDGTMAKISSPVVFVNENSDFCYRIRVY